MGSAVAYAFRRTSARVVLAVGAFGLLWTVWVAEPLRFVSMKAFRTPVPRGVYRVLWSGLSPREGAAAALLSAIAVVAAVALWRGRAIAR
jgi:hypothetical protein